MNLHTAAMDQRKNIVIFTDDWVWPGQQELFL